MQSPDPMTVTIAVSSAQMDALGGHTAFVINLTARSTDYILMRDNSAVILDMVCEVQTASLSNGDI